MSGQIAAGEGARAFERELATVLGAPDAVVCGSGTAALVLALHAIGVTAGTEVVCPSYACGDVVAAIVAAGGTPVFCDVGPGWCAGPDAARSVMSTRTRAVIAVHVFGMLADVEGLRSLGVPVIEDAAQAFASEHASAKAGMLGDVGIFSFHATKLLTTGEGGAVVARDPDVLARARRTRDARFVASPMSDLAAALGRAQLARYDELVQRRRALANRYLDALPDTLTRELREHSRGSVFFRFPLTWPTKDYERVEEAFATRGIAVRRGVDALNHRRAGLADDRFPTTVRRFDSTVSIPLYPALVDGDVERVIDATCAVLDAAGVRR